MGAESEGAAWWGEGGSAVGSGGGQVHASYLGGRGGGLLTVQVGGTFTLAGTVSANGANGAGSCNDYSAGGGAGGGIYIQAGTVVGAGLVRANGGASMDCPNAERKALCRIFLGKPQL